MAPKIKYDKTTDTLTISIMDWKVYDTVEENGVITDYDCEGNILSIEILDATKIIS